MGVYAPGLDGKPEFFPLRPPENAEVADLAQVLAQRVGALLKRRGGDPQRSDTEDSDRLTRDHPGWPTSMRLPFAVALPQARTPAATLRLPETESIRKRSIAEAAPDAPAWRVSASTLTSPFLPKTACGLNDCAVMRRGRLWQPTAWRLCRTGDFATGLRLPGVMEPPTRFSNPLEFIEKLCALVPTPRAHTVRYHGILGPAAKWRELIVPNNATTAAAPESENGFASSPASSGADSPDRSQQPNASPAAQRHPRNYLWSELMRRVFAADVLACDRCGGRLRILATIRPPETTRKILDHLGLPSRPPPLAPAAFQELPFAVE